MLNRAGTALIVAIACAAGVVAALRGGAIEEALDLIFVGPLVLVVVILGWQRLHRGRRRGS